MKCLSNTCPFRDLCRRHYSLSGVYTDDHRYVLGISPDETLVPPQPDESRCPWYDPRESDA